MWLLFISPKYIYLKMPKRETYQDLLLSDKWASKRNIIFKRDGFVCQKCGGNGVLNCHHKYYVSGKKPWEYPNSALITLCEKCHTTLHATTKISVKGNLKSKKTFVSKDKRMLSKLYGSLSEVERIKQNRYEKISS